MATRHALALAAAVLVAVAGGCGGSSSSAVEEPDAFFKRLLGYELTGEFGKSWDLLHPGHQALVTRARYTSCSLDDFGETTLADVQTVDVYDQPIDIRAVPETTSKAVTLKLTLESGGQRESSTHTFHAVRLEDRWAWYFGDTVIDAYEQGECP